MEELFSLFKMLGDQLIERAPFFKCSHLDHRFSAWRMMSSDGRSDPP
jgi:hypothetical protein